MGCGCRKNSITRKKTRTSSLSRSKTLAKRYILSSSAQAKRKKICIKCKYSTKINSQNYIRKCSKASKHLGSIIRDVNFKCPVGNFGRVK